MIEPESPLNKRDIGSTVDSISAADPHGLISSFIRCPPDRKTTPNDIFVIWMLSHRDQTTSRAARTILDYYGAAMLRSGSGWLEGLRRLFVDIAALSPPSTSGTVVSD